ncbi:MAG TPA: hypothetical protein PLP29_18890 [Candidatus Ozemobacteraceae bacterium]|nr:hypothetical protein [Candidatus Ozemobacteraceae bacterium]
MLTLVAFDALLGCVAAAGGDRHRGIEAFAALNDGQGWLIPETLRLSDHGLGHDERARQPQPVASRLGPRFPEDRRPLSPEEARAECERHARAILGDAEFDRRFLNRPADPAPRPETPCNEPGDRDSMKGRIQQKRLFD